jgi:hypothetical protein
MRCYPVASLVVEVIVEGGGGRERERGEGRDGGGFYIIVENFCKVFYVP